MARIREYELDRDLTENDKVLGTDVNGGGTMNFSLQQLGEFLASRGLADPSALDFQFRYTEGGLATENILPGAIHYDATTPIGVTQIVISSTDLKGESTEPFAAILPGSSVELNDTQASVGTNYTFFDVSNASRLADGTGFLIDLSLAVVSSGLVPSTAELPQTDYVNLGAIGLSGGIGADGLTPVVSQPTPGEFRVTYEVTESTVVPGDEFDVTIPPGMDGAPGASIGATTSTDSSVTPNTHTVTFTTSDGSTPPSPFTITDGAQGPGTEAIEANSYAVAADGTVTLVKENGGGNVVITGIGTGGGPTPPPTFSLSLVGISTREGNDNNAVTFTGLRPAGGSGFTYSITSATTTTSGWAVSANPGTDPDTFEATAGAGVFGAADVFVSMNVTDNNVNPPTTHIPSEVATPAELRFNDGGFLTIPGTDVDHWGDTTPDSTYTLFYFEVPGTETNYQTTITF